MSRSNKCNTCVHQSNTLNFQDEENTKPVYGLVQVEWGSFRNAKANRDKFWYFGNFRDYVSFLFTKIETGAWECKYTEPCKGCNKCVEKPEISKRWWYFFMPNTSKPGRDSICFIKLATIGRHKYNIQITFLYV